MYIIKRGRKYYPLAAVITVAPGSATQLASALFVTATKHVIGAQRKVYSLDEADDWLSFLTSLQVLLTVQYRSVGGYCV